MSLLRRILIKIRHPLVHPFPLRKVNNTVNVHFPECGDCGARPGQTHDPTCKVWDNA